MSIVRGRPVPSRAPEPAPEHLRDDWETPPALFASYHRLYAFTVDVAANHRNACCTRYFDQEADGLAQRWTGHTAWCHPPHSDPGPWMRKARREAQRGVTVVGLVPAIVSADWWHEDVAPFASVRFLKGQPQFRLHRLPITDKSSRKLPAVPFAIVVYKPGRTL